MLQIHEKIEQARISAGFTQEQMANKLDISRTTYIYWERKTPSIDKIKKVAEVLDLPVEYFLDENFNNVELNTTAESEAQYLARRRRIKNAEEEFRVPLVTVKARAGYTHSYDSVDLINSLDKYAIPPGVSHSGAIWRYFEVDGDSMEDALSTGDMILCSQVPQEDWANIRNYYVYVIVTETELTIKRVFVKDDSNWVLISDNEAACPAALFWRKYLQTMASLPLLLTVRSGRSLKTT